MTPGPNRRARLEPQALRARRPVALRAGRWRHVDPTPRPRATPVPARRLAADELAEAIAALPSRQGMKRPAPKADLLEHLWHFYGVLYRRGRALSSGTYDASWSELARRCKYTPSAKVQTSLERYAALLEELELVRIRGVRDTAGRWQRLDVELLQPRADDCLDVRRERRWTRHRLTAAQRRHLAELCQDARAGRTPRRLAPRLRRNLGSPLGGPLPSAENRKGRALRAREADRRPADREVVTRASLLEAALEAAFGARGFAEVAAPDGRETPLGREERLEAVQRALIRVDYLSGRPALRDAASGLQAAGEAPDVVVEALWLAIHGPGRAGLGIQRRRDLEVALARLDRYALRGAGLQGAGVGLAAERILADVDEPDDDERLEHLGGLIAYLAATARRWRRDELIRRGERDAYRPRQRPAPRPRGRWHWPTF